MKDYDEMNEYEESGSLGRGWDYAADMSVNASDAMEEGRYPYEYWERMKKSEILERIYKVIDQEGGPEAVNFDINLLKKAQKQVLLDLFVDSLGGEYHHMPVWRNGRRYRHAVVLFCTVLSSLVLKVTDKQLEDAIANYRSVNAQKYAETKTARKESRIQELERRMSNPLVVGYFTKEATFKGEYLGWDNDYIGVLDGSRLYYFGFYKYDKEAATKKQNLDYARMHWTAWPGGEMFKTFDDFVKKYPEFRNKEEEIKRLMQNRMEDRAKKGI